MTFDDLVFDQHGCCGTHTWARAVHPSGIVTEVCDERDGTYTVTTKAGNVLMRAPMLYTDASAINARLAEDATLSE